MLYSWGIGEVETRFIPQSGQGFTIASYTRGSLVFLSSVTEQLGNWGGLRLVAPGASA